MDNCQNDCKKCASLCPSSCPICKTKGMQISLVTARSMLKEPHYLNENNIYVCLNRKCEVNYFQEGNPNYFISEDLKREIWFKTSLKSQIICYCHDITLSKLVEIVKESNDASLTKEKVFAILNVKVDNSLCEVLSPLGTDCDKLFKNAIDYAYKMKNENND